jgi:hypothetical protein
VLGDDVLAQPRLTGHLGLGADPELLLRAGHRAVGRRTGRVATDGTGGVVVGVVVGAVSPGRIAGAVVHAVVAVELLLLLRRQVPVLGDRRGVLHLGLVVGHGDPVTGELRARHRYEALVGAEKTGVHRDPRRLVGGVVVVELTDLADLVPITVVGGRSDHVAQLVLSDHLPFPLFVWCRRARLALCQSYAVRLTRVMRC